LYIREFGSGEFNLPDPVLAQAFQCAELPGNGAERPGVHLGTQHAAYETTADTVL
jgi:hypothetical protein